MTRPRRFDDNERPWARSRQRLVFCLLAALLVLAACGAEAEDDRRFANEPVTPRPPTETPAPTAPAAPTATTAPMASPETLLRTRGAPDTLYTLSAEGLVSVTVDKDGADVQTIPLPEGGTLLDFDGSPTGDRVAVLTGGDQGVTLHFYDRAGKRIEDPIPVFDAAPAATPATPTGDASATASVTWSPQGRAVLVADASRLVNVPVGGEPEPIDLDGVEGTIRQAAWSPQGTQIALLTLRENGSQRVVLLDEAGETTEIAPLEVNPGMTIEGLRWLPDGSGMVFVRAALVDGVPMNGQLFVYQFAEPLPTLLATSGQGGPSASITSVAPAPDGRSVAYVISIRDGEHWAFHSLWVRSFAGPLAYEVPVDAAVAVPRIWWVDRGLAWEQRASLADTGDREIVFAGHGRGPLVILESPPDAAATPVASPGASPAATPAASPVG